MDQKAQQQAVSRGLACCRLCSQHLSVLPHDVCRWIGGDKVPEYWGKPSPYTEGTAFLGTPTNHEEVRLAVLAMVAGWTGGVLPLHTHRPGYVCVHTAFPVAFPAWAVQQSTVPLPKSSKPCSGV